MVFINLIHKIKKFKLSVFSIFKIFKTLFEASGKNGWVKNSITLKLSIKIDKSFAAL